MPRGRVTFRDFGGEIKKSKFKGRDGPEATSVILRENSARGRGCARSIRALPDDSSHVHARDARVHPRMKAWPTRDATSPGAFEKSEEKREKMKRNVFSRKSIARAAEGKFSRPRAPHSASPTCVSFAVLGSRLSARSTLALALFR